MFKNITINLIIDFSINLIKAGIYNEYLKKTLR
jgi:hypothetical protein